MYNIIIILNYITAKKKGQGNPIWVASVSPRIYIIYYTLGFTHCMPVPWQFISLVPRLLRGSMNEEKYVMCFSFTRYAYLFTHLNLK